MACLLANEIELPLEFVFRNTLRRCHNELLNCRFTQPRGRSDICLVTLRRNLSPTQKTLSLRSDNPIDTLLAVFPLPLRCRQKNIARCKTAGWRQIKTQILFDYFFEECVRQRGEHSRSVTRIGLRAAGTSMLHATEDFFGIADNLVAPLAPHMCHKTYAAGIVLMCRIVEASARRHVFRR